MDLKLYSLAYEFLFFVISNSGLSMQCSTIVTCFCVFHRKILYCNFEENKTGRLEQSLNQMWLD
jgi:hypothetical protein